MDQHPEIGLRRQKVADRVKLHQLTRQLQTRLQYARLKVEHGWMRQNLNEVENLYFHHYRTRSPSTLAPEDATAERSDIPMSLDDPSSSTTTNGLLPAASLKTQLPKSMTKSSSLGAPSQGGGTERKGLARTAGYSPYSPSPSTALALAVSPNYANIHTRPFPNSSNGSSPKVYSRPQTTTATYINAGNSRPGVPLTASSLSANPYSMTNLSRLGPASNIGAVRGNSGNTSPAPTMWAGTQPPKTNDANLTYDSFWSTLGGGVSRSPGAVVAVNASTGGGSPSAVSRAKATMPSSATRLGGVRKKVGPPKTSGTED